MGGFAHNFYSLINEDVAKLLLELKKKKIDHTSRGELLSSI